MEETGQAQQTINRKFAALPPDLQAAVAFVPMADILLQIGREHALALDKIGLLGDVVNEFIAGDIEAEDIIPSIQSRLHTSAEKSRGIALDINRLAFRPIRNRLRGLPVPESTAPAPPALPFPPKAAVPPPPPRPIAAPLPAPLNAPQPLIIRPLPQVRPPEGVAIPKPMAPSAAAPKPPAVSRVEPPVLSPLGIRPQAPSPLPPKPPPPATPPTPSPTATYERARQAVAQELETFSKQAAAPPPQPPQPATPPQPPVPPAVSRVEPPPAQRMTKEELGEMIQRFRQERPAQPATAPTASPTPLSPPPAPTPQERPPLKLPQEKIPKPAAPEHYAADPYKEPVE